MLCMQCALCTPPLYSSERLDDVRDYQYTEANNNLLFATTTMKLEKKTFFFHPLKTNCCIWAEASWQANNKTIETRRREREKKKLIITILYARKYNNK